MVNLIKIISNNNTELYYNLKNFLIKDQKIFIKKINQIGGGKIDKK